MFGIKVNWAEVLGTSVPLSLHVMSTEMTPGVCHGCDNLSLLKKQLQFPMTQRPSWSLRDVRARMAGAARHRLSTSSSQLLQTASVKRDHEGAAWGQGEIGYDPLGHLARLLKLGTQVWERASPPDNHSHLFPREQSLRTLSPLNSPALCSTGRFLVLILQLQSLSMPEKSESSQGEKAILL